MNAPNLIYKKELVGSYFFKTQNSEEIKNYLIGPRTGVHQELIGLDDLEKLEDKLPDTVFFSDLAVKGNVSCADLEFIFLAALFLGMDFANGKTTSRLFDYKTKEIVRKFRVVINEGEDDIVWNQLNPSLLGASRGFLKNVCRLNKSLWQMLVNEAHFFNLKNLDGEELKVEDFVEIHYWNDNDCIEIDGIVVKKENNLGNFTVVIPESDDVLIPYVDFDIKDLKPYWDIPQSLRPFSFSDSSIVPLGTSSPFSIDAPPTSYWLKLGERENYLIDCGFFTDLVLEKNGGNIDALKGIILTHCHGDHFNPMPFLYRAKPIELWTTIENYKLAQKITCAKAKIDPEEFQKRFIFKQVEAMYPGFEAPKYSFGMLDIEFHYSIHPIPTIGMTIYKDDEKLLVFSSDMVDLGFMEETLLANKIIDSDRYDMLIERFSQVGHDSTLFLLDCGGDGFIHGKSGGYTKFFHDPSKIVECHRGARRPGEEALMQLAEPLNLFKIADYNPDVRITAMLSQFLMNLGLDYIVDSVAHLKKSVEIVEYNSGQPIIVEGGRVNNKIYLLDYGNCRSTTGLTFNTGDWFGEESLIEEEHYSVSYHCESPVRVLVIDVGVLKRCLLSSDIGEDQILQRMSDRFNYRRALASARIFANLDIDVKVIDDIVMDLKIEKYNSDEMIYKKGQVDDGHMFIVLSGHLMVKPKKNLEIIVGENEIVGESVASGNSQVRNADVSTKGRVDLIRIEKETFDKLLTNPVVLSRVKEIQAERS